MSSWTQVYISGLPKSINPSDEEIEDYLSKCYSLHGGEGNDDGVGHDNNVDTTNTSNNNLMWAGPGSTLIKRDDNGCCRGFAFLTFYSMDGALHVIDRINNDDNYSNDTTSSNGMRLRAELSNPGGAKKKGNNNNNNSNNKKKKNDGEYLPDLRFRRQRKPPIRKHPVVTSSDGKRTNLGNKTK